MNEQELRERMESSVAADLGRVAVDPAADIARGRKRLRRRRAARGLAAATSVAAVTALGLQLLPASSPLSGTAAHASTFLSDAAGLSAANPDAPIPSGHYRQTTIQLVRIDSFGTSPGQRATLHTRIDKWIPAGKSTQYPTLVDENFKVEFPTPQARQAATKLASYLFVDEKPKFSMERPCGVTTTKRRNARPQLMCQPGWMNPTPEFLARQPRDPDLLLAALRNNTEGGARTLDPDERAFRHISNGLSTGLVPADLRAALYRAARKIPAIQLQDNVVNLDGRPGRAVGLEKNGYRSDLIISPSDGKMIGYRLVVTRDHPGKPGNDAAGNDYEVLLAGDIAFQSSIQTKIVPAGQLPSMIASARPTTK